MTVGTPPRVLHFTTKRRANLFPLGGTNKEQKGACGRVFGCLAMRPPLTILAGWCRIASVMRKEVRKVYVLLRFLLCFIEHEQKEKHTAEEILNTLRDMLKTSLGK